MPLYIADFSPDPKDMPLHDQTQLSLVSVKSFQHLAYRGASFFP